MRKSITIIAAFLAAVLALASVGNRTGHAAKPEALFVPAINASDNAGFDPSNMDTSVSASCIYVSNVSFSVCI